MPETDWESLYRAHETPWEKGAPAPALLDWLAQRGPLLGEVLVPGCGFGHDVRAIARVGGEKSSVIGLDIAPSALSQARAFPPAATESYLELDLFRLPADLHGRFDWVFEHTCFCAIAPGQRANYVRSISDALRPNGSLLAIFYLNPWDPGEGPPGGGPPFGVTIAELDEHFGPLFSPAEQYVPMVAYPGREGRELVRLMKKSF
jgi:methyl halide transferase